MFCDKAISAAIAAHCAGLTLDALPDATQRATRRALLDAIGVTPKPGDSDDIHALRGTLLQLLSSDADLQRQARTLVERYFDDPASLPPTLVSAMLQVAAAGGDAPLYDRYLARMQASLSTPEEYYRYFNALAAFRTPALRARTMELALSKEVRTQDTSILLAQLLTSRSGQDEAWAYIKGHWPAVVDKVGSFQGMPTLAGALAAFCSADKSTDIKAFFDAHPLPEVARTLQQTYERIATCIAVDARQSPAFTRWLAESAQ